MSRLGKVRFQSNDKADVFLVLEVSEEGVEPSDEMLVNISDPGVDNNLAWVTGKVPRINNVNVSGDTAIIQAWFKGEEFDRPFYLKVYVECEMTEELGEVELELTEEEEQEKERIAQENFVKESQQQEMNSKASSSTRDHEHFY